MKKKILILSSLFVLFIAAMAPASLIERFMPRQEYISISGLSGSIWSGKIAQVSAMGENFYDVDFSLSPFAILIASLSLDVDISKGAVVGDLNVVLDKNYNENVTLNNVNLSVKANSYPSYMKTFGIELGGDIDISKLDLTIENKKPVIVNGIVGWKSSSVIYAGQEWSLGDFSVVLLTDEENKTITGKLNKIKNELGLEGQFTLDNKGVFEFVGSIATDSEQALYQAFALFNNGKPANGRLPIKFKQKVL